MAVHKSFQSDVLQGRPLPVITDCYKLHISDYACPRQRVLYERLAAIGLVGCIGKRSVDQQLPIEGAGSLRPVDLVVLRRPERIPG